MSTHIAWLAKRLERSTLRFAHSRFRNVAAPFAIGALCLTAACGGADRGGPDHLDLPPPAPRVLQQGNFSLPAPEDDSFYFTTINISDSSPGLWEATVDWALLENTHLMWVSNGVCAPEQFAMPECPFEANCPCQFAVRSETATPKPRILSIPNAAAGAHTLIVANLGPREDDFTYRVVLTPSSIVTGSATGAPAAGAVLTGRKVMSR